MNRHALGKIRVKKSGEMRRQDLSDRLRIINAPGTYLPAPACIYKNQPLGVLDQKGADRQAR